MRVRISQLKERKRRGEKFAVLTAYDATLARLLETAGVDVLLVGDSVATAVSGYDTTLPVTLDVMVHHAAAVVRGTRKALVIADMPFLTYQVSPSEAVRNAGRLLKDAGAAAVKVEGGRSVTDVVRAAGRRRHSGDGAPGRAAAVCQPAERLPSARRRCRRGRDHAERCARAAGRGSICRGPRSHPIRSGREQSPRRSRFRRLASAPAPTATARCSSAAICSGLHDRIPPFATQIRRPLGDDRRRGAGVRGRRPRGTSAPRRPN